MGNLPATITITVFEPLLVPAVRGQAFVVLRGCACDKSGLERVDSFPASRSLPMSSSGTEGPVLEVEVVTAADAETFRSEPSSARSFALVRVPLQELAKLWADTYLLAEVPEKRELPRSACLWLGLSEEPPPEGLDAKALFERSRELGAQLGRPKVGVALQCPEDGRSGRSVGTVGVTACSRMAPAALRRAPNASGLRGNAAIKEVLGQADRLTRGLHRHLEQARLSIGDHEALQATNVQLRTSIERQREKYEGLLDWLKDQVQSASTGGVMSPEEDAEMERQNAELLKLRAVVEELQDEVAEQQGRALSIQRYSLSAKRAKEETLKLYELKYQDVVEVSRNLTSSDAEVRRLTRHLAALRADGGPVEDSSFEQFTDDMELSHSPQDIMNSQSSLSAPMDWSQLPRSGSGGANGFAPLPRPQAAVDWGSLQAGGSARRAPACEPSWRYEPFNGLRMDVRAEPAIDGDRTEHGLQPGEVFAVAEELPGEDGVLFLRLADGRGWVFDRLPHSDGEGNLCKPVATS